MARNFPFKFLYRFIGKLTNKLVYKNMRNGVFRYIKEQNT